MMDFATMECVNLSGDGWRVTALCEAVGGKSGCAWAGHRGAH